MPFLLVSPPIPAPLRRFLHSHDGQLVVRPLRLEVEVPAAGASRGTGASRGRWVGLVVGVRDSGQLPPEESHEDGRADEGEPERRRNTELTGQNAADGRA